MSALIFTVSRIAGYIKSVFDSETLLQGINVSGEISGISRSGTTLYFTLKDSEAQLSCVCFIADMLSYLPKNGDKCVAKGSVSYYKKGGRLNFNVTDIKPAGEGDAALKLALLKEQLTAEGVFDAARKLPLPAYPQKIGIVTSAAGAVLHDILKVQREKAPACALTLFAVRVQGQGAYKEMCGALEYLGESDCDLIIIARGGGSAEDLSQFNEEALVRCVADCKKPVISAVGHQTDYTLCDLAADMRAATPTAAAEMALAGYVTLKPYIVSCLKSVYTAVKMRYTEGARWAENGLLRMFAAWEGYISGNSAEVRGYATAARSAVNQNMERWALEINALMQTIDAKNPIKTLARGYAAVYTDGKSVTSASQVQNGDDIALRFADGQVSARVTSSQMAKDSQDTPTKRGKL